MPAGEINSRHIYGDAKSLLITGGTYADLWNVAKSRIIFACVEPDTGDGHFHVEYPYIEGVINRKAGCRPNWQPVHL
jgi:hypothetical protein